MLFNSYDFILLFLPICLVGYYVAIYGARKISGMPLLPKVWLIAMSLWFYGAFGINYLFWFILDVLIGFGLARLMVSRPEKKKLILTAGIVFHVGALLYFKYTGLLVDTINAVAGSSFVLSDIILPIGISFFTFSQISYLVDNYRYIEFKERLAQGADTADLEKLVYDLEVNFVDYVLFVTFFPKILQGPIVSYKYMKSQFEKIADVRLNSENLMRGIILFTIGLAKKVLLADTIGTGVDYGFDNLAALTNLDAIITVIGYTFQLYFDFSGYCDMGRGVCNMMGLDLPDNFYLPYQARNIEETWKKWHMTLTAFFTKYLYIPMGGNRKGLVRMYINLMIVFLVSGMWHGAGWNFLVWGFTQGALYLIYRLINGGKKKVHSVPANSKGITIEKEKSVAVGSKNAVEISSDNENNTEFNNQNVTECATENNGAISWRTTFFKKLFSAICILLNHLYWAFSFTFFRAASVTEALDMFGKILQPFCGFHITYGLADSFYLDEIWYVIKVTPIAKWTYAGYLCMWIVLLVAVIVIWGARKSAYEIASTIKLSKPVAIVTGILFVWGVLSLSGVSTYIYLSF